MSNKSILSSLQRYRKASRHGQLRRGYLEHFLPIMLYRTTKTEHPTATRSMVTRVLKRTR